MSSIPKSTIELIINSSNIVEIISHYLKLKKSGTNYFTTCPFHQEKSGSFAINEKKQMYYCFGCGAGGNVITFIMNYNRVNFVEAVKHLADLLNITIDTKTNTKDYLLEFMERINIYYQQALQQSSSAIAYLEKRHINSSTVATFMIGFASGKLTSDFQNEIENLFSAGLIIKHENSIYDRFRERIIFPIRGVFGNIVGFGGRSIKNIDPKYLNSPETEIFNKSNEIYGIFEAKKTIKEKNAVLVVEGYFDVITLNQNNIKNVVSTMGTNATEYQLKSLFNITDNIYFCFDGDNAGVQGAWRALDKAIFLVSDKKNVHFVFLPEKHDPDSYITEYGRKNFLSKIEAAVSIIHFLVDYLLKNININHYIEVISFIQNIKPYIASINSTILQTLCKQYIASLLNYEFQIVESMITGVVKTNNIIKKNNHINSINQYLLIIKALLHEPKLAREYPIPDNHSELEICDFMHYLENNCDIFDDIDINIIKSIFTKTSILQIYQEVKLEKENYSVNIILTPDEYCKILESFFSNKKINTLPKLK